ncbi:MAG: hypothetical protein LBD68_00720 [Zoogloeaceae bacterium]|jgi:hypothetical protein|nr:hypothetical protein [Zoogloeaceae bacterium]
MLSVARQRRLAGGFGGGVGAVAAIRQGCADEVSGAGNVEVCIGAALVFPSPALWGRVPRQGRVRAHIPRREAPHIVAIIRKNPPAGQLPSAKN